MSEADASLNPASSDPPAPGAMLRAARERTHYTVRDIAAQLRLATRVIEALEADRYNELPAPAFVRGYLRGYANLLQLPVKPIIEAYDRKNPVSQELLPDIVSASTTYSHISESSNYRLLYTVLIAVALIVGLGLWWQQQQPSEAAAPDAETAALVAPETAAADATTTSAGRKLRQWLKKIQDKLSGLSGTDERASDPATAPVAADASINVVAADVAATSAAVAETAPGAADVAATSVAVAEAVTVAADVAATSVAVAETATGDAALMLSPVVIASTTRASPIAPILSSPTSDAATAATLALSPAAALRANTSASHSAPPIVKPGAIHLALAFSAASWVEVYAGDERKRIAYRSAQPGTHLKLHSQAPIDIVIGVPERVSFWLEQQPQSIIEYAPNGVARFHIRANRQIVAGSSVPAPAPEAPAVAP